MDSPATESKLHCPVCGYNLTGLIEPRCPECGSGFDRADLAARQSSTPQPFNAWDSYGRIRDFGATWLESLFTPRRLFLVYPNRHKHDMAIAYSIVCYVLATLAAFIAAVSMDIRIVFYGFGVGAGISTAAWLCETAIALVLGWTTQPRAAERSYHFWRGITHYMSGYLILTALLIVGFILVETTVVARQGDIVFWLMSFLAAPLLFAWWALALSRVVFQQSLPGWGRVLGCFLIWPIGGGAIFVGFFLSALLITMCVSPHF